MTGGTGMFGQVGVAEESTYGTYVAPTRFYEPTAEVSFGYVKNIYQGGGVAAGRGVKPGSMRVVTGKGGTGTLVIEARNSRLGLLLKHIFGSTPTPTQQNTSTGYLQAHTWTVDNSGKMLTIQSGVPNSTSNTPYSFLGCKVLAAEFACSGEELTLSIDFDFRDVTDAQTLATASYVSGQKPFHWAQFTPKVHATYGSEASVQGVRGFTFRVERPQDVDRRYGGNAGLKSEPLPNDDQIISGTIDVDFLVKADFADRFHADTSAALMFEFVGASLGGSPTIYETLRLRASQAFFNDGTPKLNGPGIVTTSYTWVGQNDLTNAVAACDYISTDTSL